MADVKEELEEGEVAQKEIIKVEGLPEEAKMSEENDLSHYEIIQIVDSDHKIERTVVVQEDPSLPSRTKLSPNSRVFVPVKIENGVEALKECVVAVDTNGQLCLDDVQYSVSVEDISDEKKADTAEQLLRLSQEAVPADNDHEASKQFSCGDCGRSFMSMKSLRYHQRSRCKERKGTDLRPFKCRVCGKGRITSDDLRKHMLTHKKIVSEQKETVFCNICQKQLKSQAGLQRHLKMHENKCFTCGQEVSTEKMKVHQTWHSEHAFLCVQCDESITSDEQLRAHEKKHSEQCCYQCECNKGPLALKQLRTHLTMHMNVKKHYCEVCGKTFSTATHLRDHMRVHTGEKPYQCDLCHQSFALRNTLKVHMMRHNNIKPHICTQCGKSFLNTYMLKEHMRCHTGERPFECDVCNKKFTTKANLRAHQKLHTGSRPFKCSYCDTAFTSKAKMVMHEDSHRGQIKHFCKYCNKGFVRKDTMLTHINTHRVPKGSCRCETCGNCYSSKSALKVHQRKHNDLKPYECGICGKQFTRSDVWKKHIDWHMKQNTDDAQIEVISVPQEQGDMQIVVDESVHIAVDQEMENGEGMQRVEIPISAIVQGDNTAMAFPENAQISIVRKNTKDRFMHSTTTILNK